MKNSRIKWDVLKKAMRKNRFIAVRLLDGEWLGINCRILSIVKEPQNPEYTRFYGFKPISFDEYIRIKGHFIN